MNCRFHFRTPAVERCPHCSVPLCDRCAAPKKCPACGQTKATEKTRSSVTCTNHPDLSAQGECPTCHRPFCPACYHSSGVCQACASERNPTRPSSSRPHTRRTPHRKGSSLKRNRFIGWAILCAVLFLCGRWTWGNWSKFGKAMDKHLHQQQAMRQKIKEIQQMQGHLGKQSGGNEDLEAYLEEAEAKAKKEGKPSETEKILSQLGERGDLDGEAQGSLQRPGAANPVLRRNAPKSVKIWRFEDHPTTRRQTRVAPTSWKVSICSPGHGARVRGLVTVQAQVDAAYPVSRAELRVDGRMDAVADHPPYRFDWATEGYANGRHSLKVLVFDEAGEVHSSSARSVTVGN